LRTTKIVVEEASSPSDTSAGAFTFTIASKASEIMSVEEVVTSSLSHCAEEESSVVETVESKDDFHSASTSSPHISLVAHNHDKEEDDEEVDDLFERIKKQRNALDEILNASSGDSKATHDEIIENKAEGTHKT
jgi:hypothetical protein